MFGPEAFRIEFGERREPVPVLYEERPIAQSREAGAFQVLKGSVSVNHR